MVTAVILGGTSLAGGRGSVVGTVLAVIILTVLQNGFALLQFSSYVQTTGAWYRARSSPCCWTRPSAAWTDEEAPLELHEEDRVTSALQMSQMLGRDDSRG